MHCTRCHGLMVADHFYDYEGTSGHTWSQTHRCMNCGHMHDPVIERNRTAALKPGAAALCEPDYHDEEVHLGREAYLAPAA